MASWVMKIEDTIALRSSYTPHFAVQALLKCFKYFSKAYGKDLNGVTYWPPNYFSRSLGTEIRGRRVREDGPDGKEIFREIIYPCRT